MDDAFATALADTGTDGASGLRGSRPDGGGSSGLVARDGTGAGLAPRNDVWRGRRSVAPVPATATGFPVLDALLPGQGWPVGGLCEVLHPLDGVGELALVLPALARLACDALRPVVWVAPPYWPFAPALRAHGLELAHVRVIQAAPQQALWAAEQCLRAGCCAAVLVWPQRIDGTALRRLQLAAETGRCHGFVFRDARHAGDSSPAPLRLAVRREHGEPVIRVLKCRGLLAPPAHDLKMVSGTIPPEAAVARGRGTLSSVPDVGGATTRSSAGSTTGEAMPSSGPGTPSAATRSSVADSTDAISRSPVEGTPDAAVHSLAANPAAVVRRLTVARITGVPTGAAPCSAATPVADAPAPSPTAGRADAAARATAAHRYAHATRTPSLRAVAEAALADGERYVPHAGIDATAAATSKDPSP